MLCVCSVVIMLIVFIVIPFQGVCSSNASSLHYRVTLDSPSSIIQNETNYSSCGEESCIASFTNIPQSSSDVNYVISAVALNNAGSSDTVVYPTVIGKLVNCTHMPTYILYFM